MSGSVNTACLRILVIDDHELFRLGLRQLLTDEGFEVVDAVDADAALRRLQGFAADVVVVGVNLPAASGPETARSIRTAAPATAVLVLATVAHEERVLQAVRAGAAGYLLKEAELSEIVSGITAV